MSGRGMILDEHPDWKSRPVRAIGYWRSQWQPDLPNPLDFVDRDWSPAERDRVIDHLDGGQEFAAWRGISNCRFCNRMNGSRCLTDGIFVWPEGFSHYLREHGVRPDEEFVRWVLERGK